MHRELIFAPEADEQLAYLENSPAHKGALKQVRKVLGYLETNLKAKSLRIHPFESLTKRYDIAVFQAYAQQNTPGAYRILWHYGPDGKDKKGKRIPIITVINITKHPK